MGMSCELHVPFVSQSANRFGDGNHSGHRVEVGDPDFSIGLFLAEPGEVGDGDAHLRPFPLRKSSTEGHGLNVYTSNNIEVLNGESDDVSNLMVIDALNQRDHQNNTVYSRLSKVFNGSHFRVHEVTSACELIHVRGHAVKLKIQSAHPSFFQPATIVHALGESQTVCVHLYVSKAQLLRHAY